MTGDHFDTAFEEMLHAADTLTRALLGADLDQTDTIGPASVLGFPPTFAPRSPVEAASSCTLNGVLAADYTDQKPAPVESRVRRVRHHRCDPNGYVTGRRTDRNARATREAGVDRPAKAAGYARSTYSRWMSSTPSSFATLLSSSRARGGWSRREIADAAAISTQFVTYLETGARHPSPDTVERLVTAMDLSPRQAAMLRRVATRR